MKTNTDTSQPKTLEREEKSRRASSLILNELWEELLQKEGTRWGRVISNSMYPIIRRGNQVLAEKATIAEVRFGDIIIFKKNGLLVTHRMLGKRELKGQLYVLEKGDALLQTDLIPAQDIIGKVSRIRMPNGKIRKLSGTGRLRQLIISVISRISLSGWTALEYCLTLGRRYTAPRQIRELYIRFFNILRKLMIVIF